ncbi:probable phosphopantothenoylcysteine decarboxylase isoform X2 [Primulina huaijiensis]|uniref:probable phosphopantothenoylcysteine decarboxylase isoform X2 n=1 Tax=Primulina huaijiensis TaxID=1492673 RepID=UPI003CC793AA
MVRRLQILLLFLFRGIVEVMSHREHSQPMEVHEIIRPRILLAACGTEAAVDFTYLCHCFSQWADVQAVATENATRFINVELLPPHVHLYESDWGTWTKLGDQVTHIELRKWADILVIAPLSANTLAKISCGLCDNLLTSIVRAWDWDNSKPLVVAPDMDPLVWKSSLTENQMIGIEDLGVYLIRPVRKIVEGVDRGLGTMEGPSIIVSTVKSILNSNIKRSRGSRVPR